MAKEERSAYDGMANLANAIRRSSAAYIAMQVTEPGSSIEEMLANADIVAAWIRGKAGQAEDEQDREPPRGALGVPFDQRDVD